MGQNRAMTATPRSSAAETAPATDTAAISNAVPAALLDRGRRRPTAAELGTIERTLGLVGDRWTFLVLRAALRGIRRFEDFVDDLGVARPILVDRLRKLVAGGLMTRELYQERPPRYEYRLTPAGVDVSPVLVALVRWGEKHLSHGERSTVLVHKPCGTELEQGFWCPECATTFGPGAISGVPFHEYRDASG